MALYVLGLWLLGWAVVAVSIVLTFTSGAPAGPIDALLRGPGQFYLESVVALADFARLTTIPSRWTDIGYAALALLPLGVHLFLTGRAIRVAAPDAWDENQITVAVFGVGSIFATVGVLGAMLFGLGAQFLVISILGVGIGVGLLAVSRLVAAVGTETTDRRPA
ncbi:hypothetical protein [Halobellus sp. GM3]|uniref:hypothetical protein n=1 Tax=Halobellus sp. GM3 TaxID=3458410 RepID=UPI00403E296F